MSLPHFSSRISVAVVALVVALGGRSITGRLWGTSISLHAWQRTLRQQVVADLTPVRTQTGLWFGLAIWAVLITGLHFGGLATGLYTRFFWWDLLTHTMSGAGVGAILAVGLRTRVPPQASPWWVVTAVLMIGAGFEVYEFLFRSFWYSWSLTFYAQDTFLDMLVNTLGGVLVLPLVRNLA